jgi:hypothetical protein
MSEINVDLSLDSKRNALSHHCGVVVAYKNYAVCQHLIETRKQGRLLAVYSDCSAAIGRKTCPAIAMRKEELLKDKPIYFQERVRSEASYMKEGEFVETVVSKYKKKRGNKPKPKPKTEADTFLSGGGDLSSAINLEVAKVVEVKGESLMEMAKRVMEKRSQVN